MDTIVTTIIGGFFTITAAIIPIYYSKRKKYIPIKIDESSKYAVYKISNNPLAELNKRIFKSANRFVVNVVYILKDCKCTYFP
jgi:hypothetical protein